MTGQPQHKDSDFNINICPSAAEAKGKPKARLKVFGITNFKNYSVLKTFYKTLHYVFQGE